MPFYLSESDADRQPAHRPVVARQVQPVEQPIRPGAGEQGRELSAAEAVVALERLFARFSERIRNQRIVDAAEASGTVRVTRHGGHRG